MLKASLESHRHAVVNESVIMTSVSKRDFGYSLDQEVRLEVDPVPGHSLAWRGVRFEREARRSSGDVAAIPRLPANFKDKERRSTLFDIRMVPQVEPPEGLRRMTSLPSLPCRRGEEPPTGNALLDHVLAKLSKPRLREALACLVKEVNKIGGKNPAKELFMQFDANGDGRLSKEEVAAGLRKLGLTLAPVELEAVMRAFDYDLDGTIDPDEFSEVMKAYKEHFLKSPTGKRRMAPKQPQDTEAFPVGSHVKALFQLPNMTKGDGTVVAKGAARGTYEVVFQGVDRPAIVKASQIRSR